MKKILAVLFTSSLALAIPVSSNAQYKFDTERVFSNLFRVPSGQECPKGTVEASFAPLYGITVCTICPPGDAPLTCQNRGIIILRGYLAGNNSDYAREAAIKNLRVGPNR